jgi:hypothetical protein
MPRGSRPGERRGGRQRATPNKRTVLTDRILAVASANPTASCDEFVAILVKDQTLPASLRVAIARKWFAARSANGRSKIGNTATARGSQATDRPTLVKSDRGSARLTSQLATGASTASSPATNLLMLPVLLSIVQEEATQPAERRKAAAELALYFLPKKPAQKKSKCGNFIADQYGFVVDPDVARELRDTKLELAGLSKRKLTPHALAKKATKFQARIKELQDSLQCPCPSTYSLHDKYNGADVDGQILRDCDRLKNLGQRRAAKQVLTPEEDLEEAICTARHDSYVKGPEAVAKQRLAKLREKNHAADRRCERYGPPLTPAEQADFRLLTLLYPLQPPPKPGELTLAEHPFREKPVGDADTVASGKVTQRPAPTKSQTDPDEELVEFDDDKLPPYCTIDRELSEKKGRTVLKWTYEKC